MGVHNKFIGGQHLSTSMRRLSKPGPARSLGRCMCQEAFLKNEFNLIEAKGWSMEKQVHIRIQIGNFDEDVVEVLTILIGIPLEVELRNCISEVCTIALWEGAHGDLVDGGFRS